MDIVKMLLRQNLNEAYAAVNEIDQLATDIIGYFAKENYPMINRIAKANFSEESLYFNYEMMFVDADNIDVNKYKILAGLINSEKLVVAFVDNISTSGLYNNKGLIKINFTDPDFMLGIRNSCESNLYKNDSSEGISKEDAIWIMKVSMGGAFRETLQHELRHAYDDFVSKHRYLSDRKSKDYYSSIAKTYNPNVAGNKMSDEQRKVYLTLPHEYWARFTSAVTRTYTKKAFLDYLANVKFYIGGWELLPIKDKKRLTKAIYRYWDNEQTNSNRFSKFDKFKKF